jgi:gliding motility-associated-like protein
MGFAATLAAQSGNIGAILIIEDKAPAVGENFCVSVTTDDFTDITELRFSVNFDETVLTFNQIQNINPALTGLAVGTGFNSIDITQDTAGIITFDWKEGGPDATCADPDIEGITLADESILFEMCFTPLGAYGESTEIEFTENPKEIFVSRRKPFEVNCKNDLMLGISGVITVGVDPLVIALDPPIGTFLPGDQVCVDAVIQEGWVNLESLQFSLDWDTSVMDLVNVIANTDIPGNSPIPGVTYAYTSSSLASSWSTPNASSPVSVDDGTLMFTVCFEIVGECDASTVLRFSDEPTYREASNSFAQGTLIPFVGNSTTVDVGLCDEDGLQVVVDCPLDSVDFLSEFCIPIRAGTNFENISTMRYLVAYNEDLLEFVSINLPSPNELLIGQDDFDVNQETGVIQVDWETPASSPNGISLDNGDIVYEICFRAVGLGGSSPISISRPARVNQNGGIVNIGIFPDNCSVDIVQPAQVGLSIGDGEVPLGGGQVCLPVTVDNFTEVTEFNFSIDYDSDLYNSAGIQNLQLSGANIVDAGPSSGLFIVTWSGAPTTFADETVLFDLCFTPDPAAEPGNCAPVSIVDFPTPRKAVTANSNGEDVTIASSDGTGCVLFPEGFGLSLADTTALRDSSICLPFTVESFDNITGASFGINWDPSVFDFDGIVLGDAWTGLSLQNFNVSEVGIGILNVEWTGPETAIPDNTVVFEVCFSTISGAGDCHEVTLFSDSEPTATTANGDGSILFESGEVCIEDRLILRGIEKVDPSCPTACDGIVSLDITGGVSPYSTIWEVPQFRFDPNETEEDELCEGWVKFTVTDSGSPRLVLTDSIFLEGDINNQPIAIGGEDRQLGCGEDAVVVLSPGQGSSAESFFWYFFNGTNWVDPQETTRFANQPGMYRLEAINGDACVAYDTVMVLPPVFPVAEIGPPDTALTCINAPLTLGENVDQGPQFRYLWERLASGVVVDTIGTDRIQEIDSSGRYRLTVTNIASGCSTVDNILINDSRQFPDLSLPATSFTSCTSEPTQLDATAQGAGPFTYQWTGPDGFTANTAVIEPVLAGTYSVTVTNTSTTCENSVSTELQIAAGVPDPGFSVVPLSCGADTTTINNTIADPENYTFSWTPIDGGFLIEGDENAVEPRVTQPGQYVVQVVEANSGCTLLDTIQVDRNEDNPLAEAGPNTELTCVVSSVTLEGTGSVDNGEVSFRWLRDGIEIGTTASIEVDEPATYYLEVTSLNSNCVAIDSTVVSVDESVPEIALDGIIEGLSCENNQINITADISPPNGAYQITWTPEGDGGNIVGPDSLSNIVVDQPGTYRITVIDPGSGCSATATTVVDGSAIDRPTAAVVTDQFTIDCTDETATLDATGSSTGSNITYRWTNAVDGELPQPNDQTTVTISTGGVYRLTVTNTDNMCTDTASVTVTDLKQLPSIVKPLNLDSLTCTQLEVNITVQIANAGDDVTVTWAGADGQSVNPATGLSTTVEQAGWYYITAVNNENSCSRTDSIEVISSVELAEAQFAPVDSFGCETTSVLIDASGTGPESEFSEITWTTEDGGTITPADGSFTVQVDAPGTYVLSYTSNNGCSTSASVVVVAADDRPVADAGEDFALLCGETATLDAGGSTGENLTFQWTTLEGTPFTGDPNSAMVDVAGEGRYEVFVGNSANGCTDRDTITVTLDFGEPATTAGTLSFCGPEGTLSANLPAGATGVWTSTSGAVIADATNPNTTVSGLIEGQSVFVWTLSRPGCEDYSSAELTVVRESAFVTNDDELQINAVQRENSVNLLANDLLNGATDVSVALLDSPPFGVIDSQQIASGILRYDAGQGTSGSFTLRYEICSRNCPDLCVIGEVTVFVEDDGFEPPLPNAITPNGDGLNETLVFDILLNNPPDEFPDNELIIFNRWGDIIYQARPYNNDWDGRNQEGELLPEATYYYILRLNIGEGKILRGDVTILR